MHKCTQPWGTALLKGVGANWLVNLAVQMALSSKSSIGKVAAIWPPITAFVALGFEHSVANMSVVTLGIMCGAKVSYWTFVWSNLVPVIIGNVIGACFCVGLVPWYTAGMPMKQE